MANKDNYEKLIYDIHTLVKQNELYPKYNKSIVEGKNDFKISQAFTKKNYSTEWIDILEDCITALDTIVRNPRKFIVIEEDIVDISLARSISVDSVKHLAQHTNLISSVTKDGMVIPAKILNTSKEESYEIYENRFIYTLLLKARDFLNIRFEAIKGAMIESGELGVEIKSDYRLDGQKVTYDLSSHANFPFETVVKGKASAGLTDMERLTRMKSIFGDFLSSVFAKEMSACALVRPPIQRTNVILKDPNFKKALVLWQYIESAEKMEFKVETETEVMELPPALNERYRSLIFLNTVLLQSIAAARDTNETYAEVEKKQKETADEYISKNIDDFVPDDFPFLKMELSEVRRIYYKIPNMKTVYAPEVAKMNAALDRVLRQYQINKSEEESELRARLVEQQLKEEAEAKALALRAQQDAERRKKQQELYEKREAERLKRERLAREKEIEDARIAAEKAEEEARLAREKAVEDERLRLEEEARIAEQERLNLLSALEEIVAKKEQEAEENRIKLAEAAEQLLREEEELKQQEEENLLTIEKIRIQKELNQQLQEKLEQERREQETRLAGYVDDVLQGLRIEAQKERAIQRELALRMLTEELSAPLQKEQDEALKRLKIEEAVARVEIKHLEDGALGAMSESLESALERLKMEARTFHTLDEVIHIARGLTAGQAAQRQPNTADKMRAKSAEKGAEERLKRQEIARAKQAEKDNARKIKESEKAGKTSVH